MRAFSASSVRTIRRTVVLYPTFQLFLIPLFLIGFSAVFYPTAPAHPDQILPHILMHMEISPFLVGLFCAGALAASMSSGDAMAHGAASIAVRDGLLTTTGRSLSPERERRWIRIAVVVLMLAAYCFATAYQGSLVKLLLSAYGAVVQFMPALIATLYIRRVAGAAVFASVLSGTLVTLYFVLRPEDRPFALHAGFYGLVVNVTVLVVGSRFLPRDSDLEFLAIAARTGPVAATDRQEPSEAAA
jgi:SSS family solute:Na+ symporter